METLPARVARLEEAMNRLDRLANRAGAHWDDHVRQAHEQLAAQYTEVARLARSGGYTDEKVQGLLAGYESYRQRIVAILDSAEEQYRAVLTKQRSLTP